jgi:hypothetical protein
MKREGDRDTSRNRQRILRDPTMLNLIPRISNTGVTGVSLLIFAVGKLSPHATPPAVLYMLTTVGATLIVCDAVAFGARLMRRRIRAAEKHASLHQTPTAL